MSDARGETKAIEIPRSIGILVAAIAGTGKDSEPVRNLLEAVYREGYEDGAFAEKMRSSLGD